ncbi:hypothetical protein SDC9_174157 [bioreactor metagenome]|uniref:Uncharacterized protein n=1 Tax=bioreactor metagenome TaxID=1076179 RepID=A0A645GLJ2_9ZZZZ
MVASFFPKTIASEEPERFELLGGAEILAPPEPTAGVFMPGAEDDGDLSGIGSAK